MATCKSISRDDILHTLGSGPPTEEQARTIVTQGSEVAVFALLEVSKKLAEQQAKTAAESHQTPSTPLGKNDLFTFLGQTNVPFDNIHGERVLSWTSSSPGRNRVRDCVGCHTHCCSARRITSRTYVGRSYPRSILGTKGICISKKRGDHFLVGDINQPTQRILRLAVSRRTEDYTGLRVDFQRKEGHAMEWS
jgi:hypothetical protein